MQFFRKIYHTANQFRDEIIEDLCSLGFNSATDDKDFPSEPVNEAWLKWKNEPILFKQNNYIECRAFQPIILNDNYYTIRLSNSNMGAAESYGLTESTKGIFFIPLVNNSFFMRAYQEDDPTATIPYFHNLLELFQTNAVGNNPEHPIDSLWTYMGLQTSNLSEYSPYLYFLYNGTGTVGGNQAYTCVIDRNNKFMPEGFDHYLLQGPDNTGGIYYVPPLTSVTVSANTCILVKVPFTNDYIDGLYYIVVSPQESVDGKFFSFGGRNFLGAGRNLVVELPTN